MTSKHPEQPFWKPNIYFKWTQEAVIQAWFHIKVLFSLYREERICSVLSHFAPLSFCNYVSVEGKYEGNPCEADERLALASEGPSWNPGFALAVVVYFLLTHFLPYLPFTLSLSLNNVCQKWIPLFTTKACLHPLSSSLLPPQWTIIKWPPLSMALSCCDLTSIKCQMKLMDSNCQRAEAYTTQWIIVMEWVMS